MSPRLPAWVASLLCGAGMGVADAVPGVSGGTVLLIASRLEIYLASLAAVLGWLRRPFSGEAWRQARLAFAFLIPLVTAQATCLLVGVLLLVGGKPDLGDAEATRAALAQAPGLLVNPATAPWIFAIFFGLVLASLDEPWRHRRTAHLADGILALIGAALAAGMALTPAAAGDPALPLFILGGAVAITVMILPGVSGSLALLLLGMYQPVAAAVHDRDLVRVAAFVVGIVVGLAIAVPILRRLLARFHDRTMAFLSGLMAGSLVALWPWKPHYLPEAIPILGPMRPQAPGGSWWGPALALVAAVVAMRLVLAWTRKAGNPERSGHTSAS